MERNIKIDDTMQETIEQVQEEVKDRFNEIRTENPDYDSEDICQEISDDIHEIVDSNTPIYYSEIDGLYYLYSAELEEAYNNAGCYNEQPDNYRQVCIYFYLSDKAHEYLQELQDEIDK